MVLLNIMVGLATVCVSFATRFRVSVYFCVCDVCVRLMWILCVCCVVSSLEELTHEMGLMVLLNIMAVLAPVCVWN